MIRGISWFVLCFKRITLASVLKTDFKRPRMEIGKEVTDMRDIGGSDQGVSSGVGKE